MQLLKRITGTRLLCLLLAGALHAFAAQAQVKPISYSLSTGAKVSLAVYDAKGKLVRTLLSAQARTAGTHTETWNGLDDQGKAVPYPATCTWKLLQTQGLRAEYAMTLGTRLPQGKDRWEVGLGNHIGPRAVAVDPTGIYLGAGSSENVSNALKMSWDGNTRIWSAWQPARFMGRFSMAVMDGWVYHLQQDARVAAHQTDKPNVLHQSVGDPVKYSTGIRWDALWPGTTRPGSAAWVEPASQPMDMAAYNSGSNPQLVVSYRDHNVVQWRAPQTGQVLKTVSVTRPLGVTIDNAGNVLVISQGKILKINKDRAVSTLIGSNLDTPYRLDVDRKSGEILVAEQGLSQRVKRFSAGGQLLKTYGAYKGRQYGLYKPTNFRDVVDICADNQGGFLVVENGAPRRVARFNRDGSLIKEWYGGGYWVPSSSPDPQDPTTVWYTINGQEIMRLKVDYAKKTWSVHSVYNYLKAGDGKTITPPFTGGLDIFGGGYFDWHVRKRNGATYLVRRNELQIIKVDEVNWVLKPVVAANFAQGAGGNQKAWLWTDANGDGIRQDAEYRRYNWGEWGWNRLSLQAPVDFDYYRFSVGDGKIYQHDVTGWNAVGAPIFRDLNAQRVYGQLTGFDPANIYQNPPGFFAKESASGPLYVAINANVQDWAKASYNKMFRVDKTVGVRWAVGQHAERPDEKVPQPAAGKVYTFKNNVGVVNGTVVAADFVGGWNGYPGAITYAWDADGLFVDGLFKNPDLSIAPLWQYCHSTDNGAGTMYTDPATKDVLYFAGAENAIRIYRVKGWNGWVRKSGSFTASAARTAAPEEAQRGDEATQEEPVIALYPNPATEEIRVALPVTDAREITLELFDQRGTSVQRVHQVITPGQVIPMRVSHLPAGPYLLTVKGNGQAYSKKVLVGR